MEAITCLPQNRHFAVNEDEWDTKEGAVKSMKNALYVQWYGERHLSAKVTSNSEKIKPVALAIVKLRESEGIRQTGRQAGR